MPVSETLPMSVVERHVEELRALFPGTTGILNPDGTTLIHVPNVKLPAHWGKKQTGIWFFAPVGYPMARPDCFWADADLALKSGAPLKNAHQQIPPFGGEARLWFSWHVQHWNPHSDTLRTFMRVIRDRLGRTE